MTLDECPTFDRWILFGAEVLVVDHTGAVDVARYLRPQGDGVHVVLVGEFPRRVRAEWVHLLEGPRPWIAAWDLDAPPEDDGVEAMARRASWRRSADKRRR